MNRKITASTKALLWAVAYVVLSGVALGLPGLLFAVGGIFTGLVVFQYVLLP